MKTPQTKGTITPRGKDSFVFYQAKLKTYKLLLAAYLEKKAGERQEASPNELPTESPIEPPQR